VGKLRRNRELSVSEREEAGAALDRLEDESLDFQVLEEAKKAGEKYRV